MRIYEINVRAHCKSFGQISQAELKSLRRAGFDAIWLMGVWRASRAARLLSKVISEDFEGSPYAVPCYEYNPKMGGRAGFAALLERAHRAGLRVLVDFVSNHTALDSPWITKNPDFYIRSDPRARKQNPNEYFFHHPSGQVIAFGRDPYFPPWYDTAQLDYTSAALRAHMVQVLKRISRTADGVRCDMAMLVLRDQIRRQWYPNVPDSWFDERMPGEFWDEAISQVKSARPDFTFLAEVYWDKEEELLRLGFDLVYDKKLYDGLVWRNAQMVAERLARPPWLLSRSLFFIENHDEERAAAIFSRAENLAAMALILSLPGSILIHEGQMEGRRKRAPVHLTSWPEEPPDLALKASYEQLLEVTSDGIFKRGSFRLFDCRAPGVVSFMRLDSDRVVCYIGQIGHSDVPFRDSRLDLSALSQVIGSSRLRLTDLLTRQSVAIEPEAGALALCPRQLGVGDQARFCLVEAASA